MVGSRPWLMKNITESTASFEAWLRSQIELYEPDLQVKHRKMAEDPFEFMRATFYRWAEVWPERCKALANTHHVVGVGDLHIENFGTWRDRESRMIWGVNDFDEVNECAFTVDLVRLAVSVGTGWSPVGSGLKPNFSNSTSETNSTEPPPASCTP